MPRKGGQATTYGIDYQAWYIAFKLVDVLLEENKILKPESNFFTDIVSGELRKTAVDDILFYSENDYNFINVKSHAPSGVNWTVKKLISQGVFKQFKKQYEEDPNSNLVFVSQHSCTLFSEVFPRVSQLDSISELKSCLNSNKYSKDWQMSRNHLNFSEQEMIKFSNKISFELFNIETAKGLIKKVLKGHLTNYDRTPLCLFSFSIEAMKKSQTIQKKDIISFLENNDIHLKSHLKVS